MKASLTHLKNIWTSLKKILVASFPSHKYQYTMACTGILLLLIGTGLYYCLYASYPYVKIAEDTLILTDAHNWFEILIRSLSSALLLFAFNIDSNAIDGWLEATNSSYHWLGIALPLVALCAGIWTIYFIIRLLWRTFRIWLSRYRFAEQQHNSLYVFWEMNRRSMQMARELNSKDPDGFILFITDPIKEEIEGNGWQQLISRSTHRAKLQKQIEGLRASILITEKSLMDVTADEAMWHSLGIDLMKQYIKSSNSIHVLLLGEDENANIYSALKLSKLSVWGDKNQLAIHCLARRDNANRLIEDVSDNSVIEIIDSSHLAIELLKKDSKNHPVHFVEKSEINPGTVSSSFNSLIVGFSECGQDALRFLYEFSAFVDARCTATEDTRSPFFCDIVDKQLQPSAARWMNHAQDVFCNSNMSWEKRIKFHEMDYGSEKFYDDVLSKIISNLNYVVIAVGDDKAGITLAVDIIRYAIKVGRITNKMNNYLNIDKFRVYVRSYNPNMYEYLETIASYYNEGGEYISIFGNEHELFTYNMLIDSSLNKQAHEYFYNYSKIEAKLNEENEPQCTIEELWSTRRQKALSSRQMSIIQDLRRQESQDFANALHIETKKILKLYGASPLRLAQTEHLRWLAAHEIMGYKYDTKKDIARYKHNCMKPFCELSNKVRAYDFLTFLMLYETENFEQIVKKSLEIFHPKEK